MMKDSERGGFAAKVAGGYGKKKADGDEGDSMKEESESDDDAAREAAGKELADALKSGNGMEIYSAFEALNELCKGG